METPHLLLADIISIVDCLTRYIQEVSNAAPLTPIIYYHLPDHTNVTCKCCNLTSIILPFSFPFIQIPTFYISHFSVFIKYISLFPSHFLLFLLSFFPLPFPCLHLPYLNYSPFKPPNITSSNLFKVYFPFSFLSFLLPGPFLSSPFQLPLPSFHSLSFPLFVLILFIHF